MHKRMHTTKTSLTEYNYKRAGSNNNI
jgi:hypothetical protein